MISVEMMVGNIVHGVMLGCVYALIAVGMNLIYGNMGVKNLAHGDFVMLGMFITYWLFTLYGINPLVTIPITFILLFIVGILVTKYLFRLVFNNMTASILITFALSVILENLVRNVWGADYRTVNIPFIRINLGITSIGSHYLLTFAFALAFTLLLNLFITRTKMGVAIRAVTQDSEVAASLGVDVDRVRMLVGGISLGLAGACGSLLTLIYYTQPYIGVHLTLMSLIMCVVGGLGSITGAFIGAIIISLAQTLSSIILPYGVTGAVGFLIFILILIFKPHGLYGK